LSEKHCHGVTSKFHATCKKDTRAPVRPLLLQGTLRNNTPFTVHYLDTDILIAVHVHTKISVKFPVKKITSSILGPIGLWDCGVGSYAPVEKMSVL